jgi:uncharacterized protein YdeI (YjbR/CyaY-like superfamily)
MDESIKKALQKARLLEAFNKLPPSHQREYLSWINQAKRPETRQKRIEKMVGMLRAKQVP